MTRYCVLGRDKVLSTRYKKLGTRDKVLGSRNKVMGTALLLAERIFEISLKKSAHKY